MSIGREAYPTDVSDDEWAFAAPYLTLIAVDAGQRVQDLREVFNALRWLVKSGSPWRLMPHDFPPWQAVYQQARRWLAAGCFEGMAHDLRAVIRVAQGRGPSPTAAILDGRTIAKGVRMLVVPGSMRVRFQAEEEGLDAIFTTAGAEWRSAGCSMCLGMNPDQLAPGERCASTSNRNFEGRQGKGGRTHLVSPLVAAATAVRGTLSSPEDLD